MNAATAVAEPSIDVIQNLAADFRQFVASLQQAKSTDRAWVRTAQERCQELSERFEQLRVSLAARRQSVAEAFGDVRASLSKAAEELAEKYNRQSMKEMQASLVRRYEDFVAQVRTSRLFSDKTRLRFRSLRLPKATRSIFHAGMGLACVLMYQLLFSQQMALTILGSALALFASLEISRRFSRRWNDFMVYKLFGAISRPQERYKTNSATYYLLAMTLITLLTPREAVCMALLVLGFGDPLASAVGSRWGRIRLTNDKSLIGSLAFFSISLVACFVYLSAVAGHLPILNVLGICAAVALVGAVVELFSHRFDDNFTIPVACALTGLIWF